MSANDIDVLHFEKIAASDGFGIIAGIDEAGRGPLAGPVVAAAVVLPFEYFLKGVDDSKRLSPEKRTILFTRIFDAARSVGIGYAGCREIDSINILEATRLAMKRAIQTLSVTPDCLLLDAVRLPGVDTHQIPIIKGDRLSHSIAAASIIAKVVRDRLMDAWHSVYSVYGWQKNKGYGTKDHLDAIRRHGPSPVHRMSFRGVCDAKGLFDVPMDRHLEDVNRGEEHAEF